MTTLTWFGHWQSWAMIAVAWILGVVVTALIMAMITKVGSEGEEEGE